MLVPTAAARTWAAAVGMGETAVQVVPSKRSLAVVSSGAAVKRLVAWRLEPTAATAGLRRAESMGGSTCQLLGPPQVGVGETLAGVWVGVVVPHGGAALVETSTSLIEVAGPEL